VSDVLWDRKLVDRAAVEPSYDLYRQGVDCPMCLGSGLVTDQIDDDRPAMVVRCWKCKGTGQAPKPVAK
jgi:DnaJ-class molecular chaperone